MPSPIETFVPAETYEEALKRACELWGVQQQYWDIWGTLHIAEPDVQRRVLTSLGVAAETKETLNLAMEERAWEQWSSIVSRTIVAGREDGSIPVYLPIGRESGRLQAEFVWENGTRQSSDLL